MTVNEAYPARYYVQTDATGYVTHWNDTATLSDLSGLPSASEMTPVSEADWNDPTKHLHCGVAVKNGALVLVSVPAVPVATLATVELTWISQEASLAAAMGQTFTPDMRTYVAAIQAIANGTDMTSTALPARPTQIMS